MYEFPELLEVGQIANVVLGSKSSIERLDAQDSKTLASILDID
jgi:hypothetical protein